MANKKIMTLFNYIGGKTWLRNQLREEINKNLIGKKITTYVEPFAGGLGAFLGVYDILVENKIKTVILNDINSKLINFYKIVKNEHENLINEYMKLELEYEKTIPLDSKLLHKTKDKIKLKLMLLNSELFYKKIRNKFNSNQSDLESAVSLLFLQNHCFNGIYRENLKGGYNTPFNWESKTFNEEKIREKIVAVNKVFNLFVIEFSNKSFVDLNYNNNSFYYLDPPYINDINTNENKYNKDSFDIDKQKLLIKKIKGASFLYSNHDNDILIKEFEENNMSVNINKVSRKNIISSSNESRKTDKIEILVSSKHN